MGTVEIKVHAASFMLSSDSHIIYEIIFIDPVSASMKRPIVWLANTRLLVASAVRLAYKFGHFSGKMNISGRLKPSLFRLLRKK